MHLQYEVRPAVSEISVSIVRLAGMDFKVGDDDACDKVRTEAEGSFLWLDRQGGALLASHKPV